MSKKDEQALVGRAMMEPDFRKRLLEDPVGTVKAEQMEVSGEFLEQFKGLDANITEKVSALIGSVFGQPGVRELKMEELDAVAGGVMMVAPQPLRPPVLRPGTPVFQKPGPPAVAPTTW